MTAPKRQYRPNVKAGAELADATPVLLKKVRLIPVPLLALGMALIFVVGSQRALGNGWRQAVAPLLADYVDRLAADIGAPPSVERARALADRLPISIRIDGPVVRWQSGGAAGDEAGGASVRRWRDDDSPRLLERTTADGHHIVFGWADLPWKNQPRTIGWVTLGLLLLFAGLAVRVSVETALIVVGAALAVESVMTSYLATWFNKDK